MEDTNNCCGNETITFPGLQGIQGIQGIQGEQGDPGDPGVQGDPGTPGNYTVTTDEPGGVNCANGGVKIELFDGSDDSLISTHYACNGLDNPEIGILTYEVLFKNQSGTSAPSPTIINDDIAGVWSRASAGTYRYTKASTFSESTTFFTCVNGLSSEEVRIRLSVDSSSYITLKTYNSSGVLADDLIEQMYLSIKVRT
jgi:hypothetical protein